MKYAIAALVLIPASIFVYHKRSSNLRFNDAFAAYQRFAAATGTLTNAPAAGNPTKWIAIDDNGTTRYIPAW